MKEDSLKEDILGSQFSSSARSSLTSSVPSRNRKISRIEQVKVGGTTVLVELDEELTFENNALHVARKDSLSNPTTVGGVSVEGLLSENSKSIGKDIQNKFAHHSPDIAGIDSGASVTRGSDTKSEESNSVSSSNKWELFRDYFSLVTFHLHLAFASPAIVRIPHLAHKYASQTGSAFFFAYVVCLIAVGTPICIVEMLMAQFSSLGPINLFGSCLPLIQGVGVGMIAMSAVLTTISSVVMSWSTFYFWHSFTSDLPWEQCPSSNTSFCKDPEVDDSVDNYDSPESYIPSDYYFQSEVVRSLDVDSGDPLQLNSRMAAILLGLWALLLLFLSRHTVWRPKLITSCFALVTFSLFLTLMITGLQLENSGKGLQEALQLNFTNIRYELGKPDLWMDCVGQVFWSLGPCIGVLINKASYNNFRRKISIRSSALQRKTRSSLGYHLPATDLRARDPRRDSFPRSTIPQEGLLLPRHHVAEEDEKLIATT